MQRPVLRRLAATAQAAVLAGALAGCGATDADRATDPGTDSGSTPAPASELAAHDGEPCPDRLPPGEGDEPAEQAPALAGLLTAADQAWTCRYEPRDAASDRDGTAAGWVRDAPARPVGADALRRLEPHLGALRPAQAQRICTMDLGPRWLLVLSDGGDLTGVVVDGFGCRDVRLTEDPFEAPPGDARTAGTVAGVLTGPDHLLPAIARLAGGSQAGG